MSLPNKTAPNMNSFVNVPKSLSKSVNTIAQNANTMAQNAFTTVNTAANSLFKTANTAATNAANSMGNIFAESVAPINESIQGSFESTVTPFLTIPMVIMFGMLVIALIIFVKFKHQIVLASEMAMHKLHAWWRGVMGPQEMAPSMPPPNVDGAAIDRMLPVSHGKEVFHVGDQKYRYDDAAPLCESMGATLATYDDVKAAMQKGADWCSLGWVKGQMAVYPTQDSTFQKLQLGPEDQRMACGKVGLNGGTYDNPDLRLGVTCIGNKPAESDKDKRAKNPARTPGALAYDKKVNDFKNHTSDIPVAPFNATAWNA